MERRVRHLLSIDDLTDADLEAIVARGADLAEADIGCARPLDGRVVGVYFRQTSTRTRLAFSCGAARLGAQVIGLNAADLQTATGETSADTGTIFAGMLDAVIARTAGDPAELRGWAAQDRMAVINAMTADEHPTQALADLTTLRRCFGRIKGLRLLYVGEGNNTATALALALSRYPGVRLELRTPPGYGLPEATWRRAADHARRSGAELVERHTMDDPPAAVDVIYTTRWQTTGTTKPDPGWRKVLEPYRVSDELWERSPDAVFMHDLPAHRGEEVTAEVLDGPRSIAFEQARNKLYSAMAVLEWCLGAAGGRSSAA